MRLRSIIFLMCIILMIVLFSNGIYIIHSFLKLEPDSDGRNIGYPQSQKLHMESSTDKNPPFNLMVLGLDEEGLRTDVIFLMNFEPETSKLSLLSIPRDTKVFARGKYSKINALYSAGKEHMVADTILDLTGLSVQYYMTMRFIGFRKVVDTLDGVVFDVPFDMDYDDPTQGLHIHLDKGLQRLDGNESEQLVRYRKGNRNSEGYIDGDIGRMEMQQDFIRAMVKQKLNLKYLDRADDVFAILAKYMRTNFGIADFSHYLSSIRKIKDTDIKEFTLPGESKMEGKVWYYIADEQKTKELVANNFYQ